MTSTLVSALHVLATASGCTSVAAFADWLLSAPETISNIMRTAGFEADVEAMQASEAAKAASAAAEVEGLRAELVAARAAAAAAQDDVIATAAQAAADVEEMSAKVQAAQAEVEAMRAEARKIARTHVKATTADAVVVEAMAMLEARDLAQAQQVAALLQLQARHRAELQSMHSWRYIWLSTLYLSARHGGGQHCNRSCFHGGCKHLPLFGAWCGFAGGWCANRPLRYHGS